jgi:hypothetical protein
MLFRFSLCLSLSQAKFQLKKVGLIVA